MFAGYKTYITAAVAIIAALASYMTGDIAVTDAAQLILTAVLGATIRNGIAKSA